MFEVNANGQVEAVPQKRILSNADANDPDQCKSNGSENGSDSKETSVVQVTSGDTEMKHQRYGDWALYGYFFKAAGLRNVVLWLAAIMLAAIVERFPRKYTFAMPLGLVVSVLTLCQQSMSGYGRITSRTITSTLLATQS